MAKEMSASPALEADLAELLSLIQGKLHPHWGSGITSYYGTDWDQARKARNDTLHAACLELERRGLIRRFREEEKEVDGFKTGEGWVIWEEVDPDVTP